MEYFRRQVKNHAEITKDKTYRIGLTLQKHL